MQKQFEDIHRLFEKMPSEEEWIWTPQKERASKIGDELMPLVLEIIDLLLPASKKIFEVNGADLDYNAHDEGGELRSHGKVKSYLIPCYLRSEEETHVNQRWMPFWNLGKYVKEEDWDFALPVLGTVDELRAAIWYEMDGQFRECWNNIQSARLRFKEAYEKLSRFEPYASIVLEEHERKREPLSSFETSKLSKKRLQQAHRFIKGFRKRGGDTMFFIKPKAKIVRAKRQSHTQSL